MKPISCYQETGDTEMLLCSGTPQGLAHITLGKGERERKLIPTRAASLIAEKCMTRIICILGGD